MKTVGTGKWPLHLGRIWTPVIVAMLATVSNAAMAETASPGEITELRRQLVELRAEQKRTTEKIAQVETALDRIAGTLPPLSVQDPDSAPQVVVAAGAPNAAPVSAGAPARLQFSGDFRLRYESNFGDADARNRDRGVLRARLRAAYAVNSWLTVGGQLATGDADDPNSTDITLSSFDDDLDVSLDQVYAKFALGKLTLHGGKIPQPFVRTELVWDGDVSPQGLSASYKLDLGGGASIKANGLYFLIDESVAGKNSDMVGGQLAFETSASAPLKFELAAGYYDYQLGSTAGGDAGDFRSNRFLAGRYLSDFDLLDVIAAVQYNGFGDAWPVRLVGDYVHNFGATVPGDSGFGVDFLVGRAAKKGDLRFGYGYAQTGVDAVFAAFSHDNTNIATNYRQHSLSMDFVPVDNLILNATYYRYRPKDPLYAAGNTPSDWLDRLRLNMLVNF